MARSTNAVPANHPPDSGISAEAIRSIAAIAGISLSNERAEALRPQLEAHIGLLRVISALDPKMTEPAGELHLPWKGTENDD
jgi:Asp-tRNA(Asn)/Glu-tRNA(Gln) amidotransferase C subunit